MKSKTSRSSLRLAREQASQPPIKCFARCPVMHLVASLGDRGGPEHDGTCLQDLSTRLQNQRHPGWESGVRSKDPWSTQRTSQVFQIFCNLTWRRDDGMTGPSASPLQLLCWAFSDLLPHFPAKIPFELKTRLRFVEQRSATGLQSRRWQVQEDTWMVRHQNVLSRFA